MEKDSQLEKISLCLSEGIFLSELASDSSVPKRGRVTQHLPLFGRAIPLPSTD
jgi:hypothetical protein